MIKAKLRWLVPMDLNSVLTIEEACFLDQPWDMADFKGHLEQRNTRGMVAEQDGQVIGFMLYEIHTTRLHLINLAVHPARQRRGVGSQFLRNLIDKQTVTRTRITTEVTETNLDALAFFKRSSFRATSVLPEFYKTAGEDAYLLEYQAPTPALPQKSGGGSN